MTAAEELGRTVGVVAACEVLDIERATLYRRRRLAVAPSPRSPSLRALGAAARAEVLAILNEVRFADKAPAEVFATLLDEGTNLCSVSTMYRLLRDDDLVRMRRNQLKHHAYTKLELLATGPNQLWSWDITKLKGPEKWSAFHLYVILDVFSRYVVGWMVAERESAGLQSACLPRRSAKRRSTPPGSRSTPIGAPRCAARPSRSSSPTWG